MTPELRNVGIDATCWLNKRGYGRHVRSLLPRLVEEDRKGRYTFFFDSPEPPDGVPEGVEVRLVNSGKPAAEAASVRGYRSPPDLWRMSRALSAPDLDILIFPSIYTFVPVRSRARKVVFIHDITPEKFPQFTHPQLRGRLLWKTKVALGIRQADAVITVSGYSRKQISSWFRLAPDRIFVVGEAPSPAFRRLENKTITPLLRQFGIAQDTCFIIYAGGFDPHKNVESLIEAFARVAGRPEGAGLRLVLVGENRETAFDDALPSIRRRIESLGVGSRVTFTGYLPDEELVVLLNLARALVLPSWMEGFGLPAIEAAACGCPVIATRESPLPDILGDAALYVEPGRADQISEALLRVLSSYEVRGSMSEQGLAAARRLSWDEAARQLVSVLDRLTEA